MELILDYLKRYIPELELGEQLTPENTTHSEI